MTEPVVRVLHLLGELRLSGAETMLAAAAPAFAARGVSGEILGTGRIPGQYAGALAAAGYRIHHVPFTRSPAFFLRLWRLCRRFDAVHVHAERAAFWTGLTALAAGVPVCVRSIHNAFAFTGGLRLRRMAQRRLLARLGVRHVAVSRSVQAIERRHFGLDAEFIPNWFDEARFRPAGEAERSEARRALGIEAGDVVVVSVGNCNSIKNHDQLLRALGRIPEGRRPLYLHVGEEEPGAPERLLADSLGLGGRVRFLGSSPDPAAALRAADAFVMPSLREGLGISALEAIATGLPAILSDVEGLRDLAGGFPGVRLVAPRAEAIASALEDFLAEGTAARRRVAEAWPDLARRSHGLEAGVDAYVRLYRGGRRASAPPGASR